MLEVPEVNIPELIGADGKGKIVSVMDGLENAVAKQDSCAFQKDDWEGVLIEDINPFRG